MTDFLTTLRRELAELEAIAKAAAVKARLIRDVIHVYEGAAPPSDAAAETKQKAKEEFDTQLERERANARAEPLPSGLYGSAISMPPVQPPAPASQMTVAEKWTRLPETPAPAPRPADKSALPIEEKAARQGALLAELQRGGRSLSMIRNALSPKVMPYGSVASLVNAMMRDGLIIQRPDATYALPPRKVAPAPAPDPGERRPALNLTSAAQALLAVITEDYRAGKQDTWVGMAKRAGIKQGGMGSVLESLEHKQLIVRDQHGIRPYGMPALPGHSAAKILEHEAAPEAPARPKTEEEMIAEHLAKKGVSGASADSPTLDDVLAEYALAGRKVKVNPGGSLFHVGEKRMYRDEFLTGANKLRINRGVPVWDTRKVRWPNEDGTTPPVFQKEAV